MVQLNLDVDYKRDLKGKKVTKIGAQVVRSLSASPDGRIAETVAQVPAVVIPPLNTDITFSAVLKPLSKETVQRLSQSFLYRTQQPLPENFNWRNLAIGKESLVPLISKPPDQKLCGSCWAIAAADIIGDMFVVSGVINYNPRLSTTYCLSCYPQYQCDGGNPSVLYRDVRNSGIVSKHCIDYSWCDQNGNCNGSALNHFQSSQMNDLIPNCGCYEDRDDHLEYFIKNPSYVDIQAFGGDANYLQLREAVKRHIYEVGPVMGGFLVFANFMSGAFTRVNNGIYLEKGVYSSSNVNFSDYEISSDRYSGSHAVAIIGWGVAPNTVVDNQGTTEDVHYWYCRNSWGTRWGDGGYFKMAMWPHNRLAQFDQTVSIRVPSSSGNFSYVAGGIVIADPGNPPQPVRKPQVNSLYRTSPRNKPPSFYTEDVPIPSVVEPPLEPEDPIEPSSADDPPVEPPVDPPVNPINPEEDLDPDGGDGPGYDPVTGEPIKRGVDLGLLILFILVLLCLIALYFLIRS